MPTVTATQASVQSRLELSALPKFEQDLYYAYRRGAALPRKPVPRGSTIHVGVVCASAATPEQAATDAYALTPTQIRNIVRQLNTGTVPILYEHRVGKDNPFGHVVSASANNSGRVEIEFALYPEDASAGRISGRDLVGRNFTGELSMRTLNLEDDPTNPVVTEVSVVHEGMREGCIIERTARSVTATASGGTKEVVVTEKWGMAVNHRTMLGKGEGPHYWDQPLPTPGVDTPNVSGGSVTSPTGPPAPPLANATLTAVTATASAVAPVTSLTATTPPAQTMASLAPAAPAQSAKPLPPTKEDLAELDMNKEESFEECLARNQASVVTDHAMLTGTPQVTSVSASAAPVPTAVAPAPAAVAAAKDVVMTPVAPVPAPTKATVPAPTAVSASASAARTRPAKRQRTAEDAAATPASAPADTVPESFSKQMETAAQVITSLKDKVASLEVQAVSASKAHETRENELKAEIASLKAASTTGGRPDTNIRAMLQPRVTAVCASKGVKPESGEKLLDLVSAHPNAAAAFQELVDALMSSGSQTAAAPTVDTVSASAQPAYTAAAAPMAPAGGLNTASRLLADAIAAANMPSMSAVSASRTPAPAISAPTAAAPAAPAYPVVPGLNQASQDVLNEWYAEARQFG